MEMTSIELEERQQKQQLAMELQLNESVIDMFQNFVNPMDQFYDSNSGEMWSPIGLNGGSKGGDSGGFTGFRNEFDLARMRDIGRWLSQENEFAQNALANRVAFTVGTGLVYQALPKKSITGIDEQQSLADKKTSLALQSQELIDQFIESHNWGELEQELVLREDRDGEWFLKGFAIPDGTLQVRLIEPSQVSTPQSRKSIKTTQFGIESDSDDAQLVVGYWIDGQLIDASEIIHRKGEVDFNVRRGVSKLWSVRKNFTRAEKLQRNMSTVAAVQAALVAVRKFTNSSEKQVSDFVDKKANVSFNPSVANSGGNPSFNPQKTRLDNWNPGSILNMGVGQDLEFMAKGLNAANFIPVLQSDLRAIAARFVMPEFMLTSDASNANYASSMVAETPAVRQFQKQQSIYTSRGKQVMKWVLISAMAAGLLPVDLFDFISINVEAPSLIVRDPKKEAEANQIKANNGVLSIQTWSAKEGMDYQQEQSNIIEHAENFGGFIPENLVLPDKIDKTEES